MTDESGCNGDALALLITGDSNFGTLIPFEETEYAIKLNGIITVEIN